MIFFRILVSKIYETIQLSRYIANGNRRDPYKMHTDLYIRMHAIEKGMSIGNVKIGFGKKKVLKLLVDLQHYLSIKGDKEFVSACCQVIKQYICFSKSYGAEMSVIEKSLIIFCKTYNINFEEVLCGGIIEKQKSDTYNLLNTPFDSFSQGRFSIRDFGTTPIDDSLICKALKICERTPSACNRQSWNIYIIKDKNLRDKLYKLQLGCTGFIDGMQRAILICCDIRSYNINELNQMYVDGGIYSMNLLYALHYQGLATIPLTMAHRARHTNLIRRSFDIPDYLIPVLLIGVGTYKEKYRVACSERKDYKEYVKFI